MTLPALTPVPTALWECLACTLRREVPCAHVGAGVPACPTCKGPMARVVDKAPAASAPKAILTLARRDPDTVMEIPDDE